MVALRKGVPPSQPKSKKKHPSPDIVYPAVVTPYCHCSMTFLQDKMNLFCVRNTRPTNCIAELLPKQLPADDNICNQLEELYQTEESRLMDYEYDCLTQIGMWTVNHSLPPIHSTSLIHAVSDHHLIFCSQVAWGGINCFTYPGQQEVANPATMCCLSWPTRGGKPPNYARHTLFCSIFSASRGL